MRVFVTGASGWIGSALVAQLIGGGHHVVGLARSDDSATALIAAGAEAHRGTLDDLEDLRKAAEASDGVIHLAFNHELAFSGDFEGAADADRRAVETIGKELKGSDRPFVLASGVLGITPGRLLTERDGHGADAVTHLFSGAHTRHGTSEMALALAAQGVRSSIVRLSPTVHGDGDHGFIASLIGIARDRGISAYIGDGTNRWSAVHRFDAARLFRLALEASPGGTTLHGVAEEGVSIREIAEAIGRQLKLPVVSVAPKDASEHFGWLAPLLASDSPASSKLTRELLDWQTTYPGLIDDLDEGHYFKVPS